MGETDDRSTGVGAAGRTPGLLGPTSEGERIAAIDAVRGLAILGIFLVNIRFFSMTFGSYAEMAPPEGSTILDWGAFLFTRIFAESKFYPLFSMLFGMGLMMQWQRAAAAGRRFVGTYLRRLFVLFLLGASHAFLLWYGDILLLYSLVGAGMVGVLSITRNARVLIGVAAVLIAVVALSTAGLTYLTTVMAAEQQTAMEAANGAAVDEESEPVQPPFQQLIENFQTGAATDPSSPGWTEPETRAFRDGPWSQAFGVRVINYLSIFVWSLFGFTWIVVAMFLIGAGLVAAGIFDERHRRWHAWLLALGAFVGLPLATLAAVWPAVSEDVASLVVSFSLLGVAGPLMALGYLGGVTLLARSGRARGLVAALAAVGRMALTNYLLQTLIATAVFYHWGFGLFGTFGPFERFAFVVGVYLLQIVFSVLWMSRFRYGPMEWLWRSLTYLRPQAMLR